MSLVFRCQAKGDFLKLMRECIGPDFSGAFALKQSRQDVHTDDAGRSSQLRAKFNDEYGIPLGLKSNSSIVRVLHFYNGSNAAYADYVPAMYRDDLSVEGTRVEDLAKRTSFVVMQLYDASLPRYIRRLRAQRSKVSVPGTINGLTERECLRFLMGMLDASATMWAEARVVHLDLKPDNVVVGDNERAVIIDFGGSKSLLTTAHDGSTAPMPWVDSEQCSYLSGVAWDPYVKYWCENFRARATERPRDLVQLCEKSNEYAAGRIMYVVIAELARGDSFDIEKVNEICNFPVKRNMSLLRQLSRTDAVAVVLCPSCRLQRCLTGSLQAFAASLRRWCSLKRTNALTPRSPSGALRCLHTGLPSTTMAQHRCPRRLQQRGCWDNGYGP